MIALTFELLAEVAIVVMYITTLFGFPKIYRVTSPDH